MVGISHTMGQDRAGSRQVMTPALREAMLAEVKAAEDAALRDLRRSGKQNDLEAISQHMKHLRMRFDMIGQSYGLPPLILYTKL